MIAALHLVANVVSTAGFLYVSTLNYPGGEAILKLHQIESRTTGENFPLIIDSFAFDNWIVSSL
jgi:hypothetical protein